MKRFVFLLSILFCSVAFAHTIEWYVGDNLLSTTTCESGDNITPPTAPQKHGYHFTGWFPYKARIEYLESTGTQWIDTGYIPNTNTTVVLGFVNQSRGNWVFGQRTAAYTTDALGLLTSDGAFVLYTPGLEIRFDSSSIKYNKKYIVTANKNTFIVLSDIGEKLVEKAGTATSLNAKYPLVLFGLVSGGSYLLANSGTKIYYFQIYDNDILVRDFIPVLDKDGTPCMYDKVEKKFYYNAGTGNFIAGPIINE